jgi:AcrR family transcriptional regulator
MRQRKSAEERKDEIVAVTLQLAYEVGPDRISTEAIASRVGVTQAAIFRHFPRKQDIWVAVITWLKDRVAGRWAAAQAGLTDPRARLEAVLSSQFTFITAIPALPAVLLSRELHGNAALRCGLLAVMGEFRGTLADIIADGVGAGIWRTDLDRDRAANLLIALVQGTALRWTLAERGFDLLAEGRAQIALALDGFGAQRLP